MTWTKSNHKTTVRVIYFTPFFASMATTDFNFAHRLSITYRYTASKNESYCYTQGLIPLRQIRNTRLDFYRDPRIIGRSAVFSLEILSSPKKQLI